MRHWNVEEGWGETDASDVFFNNPICLNIHLKNWQNQITRNNKDTTGGFILPEPSATPTNQKKTTITSISTIIPGNITPPPGNMIFHQPHQAPFFLLESFHSSIPVHQLLDGKRKNQGIPRIPRRSLCVPGSLSNCFEIYKHLGRFFVSKCVFLVWNYEFTITLPYPKKHKKTD